MASVQAVHDDKEDMDALRRPLLAINEDTDAQEAQQAPLLAHVVGIGCATLVGLSFLSSVIMTCVWLSAVPTGYLTGNESHEDVAEACRISAAWRIVELALRDFVQAMAIVLSLLHSATLLQMRVVYGFLVADAVFQMGFHVYLVAVNNDPSLLLTEFSYILLLYLAIAVVLLYYSADFYRMALWRHDGRLYTGFVNLVQQFSVYFIGFGLPRAIQLIAAYDNCNSNDSPELPVTLDLLMFSVANFILLALMSIKLVKYRTSSPSSSSRSDLAILDLLQFFTKRELFMLAPIAGIYVVFVMAYAAVSASNTTPISLQYVFVVLCFLAYIQLFAVTALRKHWFGAILQRLTFSE